MELSLILGISVVGLLFAVYLIRDVMKRDTGTDKMREISDAIKQGAEAFLRRQNRTITLLAVVLAVIIFLLDRNETESVHRRKGLCGSP